MEPHIYSVAIDGPAGAGKSTVAKNAAKRLGFFHVDTGAIYRTVAYAVCSAGVEPQDPEALSALLAKTEITLRWAEEQHMLLNGVDVTRKIRSLEISSMASQISALPAVRNFLMETQRETARLHSVIMDGRDIGTVVLPNADVKIYLSASAEVRARRRWKELIEKQPDASFETVLKEIEARDRRDMTREVAPLRPAEDAILLDTSALTLEQSADAVLSIIREKLGL